MERRGGRTTERLRPTEAGVVLIDAQPGFLVRFGGAPPPVAVEQRWEKLLLICRHLGMPTLATFEEPDSNGWLSEACERAWPEHGKQLVKRTFDCCAQPDIRMALEEMGARQLMVAGTETDVCVLQSVLSMLELDYAVFVLEDCVASSEPHTRSALERMYRAGAVPCTLKTAYYELMKVAATAYRPADAPGGWPALVAEFGHPEELPEWDPAC
jgi:nicotinamidase-related amidase